MFNFDFCFIIVVGQRRRRVPLALASLVFDRHILGNQRPIFFNRISLFCNLSTFHMKFNINCWDWISKIETLSDQKCHCQVVYWFSNSVFFISTASISSIISAMDNLLVATVQSMKVPRFCTINQNFNQNYQKVHWLKVFDCHACMREIGVIWTSLIIRRCVMFQTTIVVKILLQVLSPKMHKSINAIMSSNFRYPPGINAIPFYRAFYVVSEKSIA